MTTPIPPKITSTESGRITILSDDATQYYREKLKRYEAHLNSKDLLSTNLEYKGSCHTPSGEVKTFIDNDIQTFLEGRTLQLRNYINALDENKSGSEPVLPAPDRLYGQFPKTSLTIASSAKAKEAETARLNVIRNEYSKRGGSDAIKYGNSADDEIFRFISNRIKDISNEISSLYPAPQKYYRNTVAA